MPEDKDFQAAHEIGKIYNSFIEKTLLCDFFLDSSLVFIKASKGYLFLVGNEEKLWLECSSDGLKQCTPDLQKEASLAFREGKNVTRGPHVFIPLIMRNSAMGVACFESSAGAFSEKEISLACDLSSQLAVALKNILLFEQNIRMERLAAIGQTMGMVLHEIKNIIQLARFGEEYLGMGIEKKKEDFLVKGREGIQKAIRELDGFTYEVLSLTKDYKISPELLDYPKLLEELRDDLQSRAAQYKVELDFQVEKDFPEVEGESRSLYRSLLNMIKNALEATDVNKPKPYIRIRVAVKDVDSYEIKIEDNGSGMSDEAKAKIFQAFFSTKGEKGTGLGLLVIDRTVKAHHGKIHVESEFGKGTKFTLTLPRILPRH